MKTRVVLASVSLATASLGLGALFWIRKHSNQTPDMSYEISESTSAKFRNAAQFRPTPVAAISGLASAFAKFQTGDYSAAIILLRKSLAENPNDALIKKNLATSLFAFGLQRLQEQKLQEAAELFEESLRLGHPQAANALARLRVKSGEMDLAISVLEDIFWKNRDVNAAMALVDLALSRDDLAAAQAWLNRAGDQIDKNPNTTEQEIDQKNLAEKQKRFAIRSSFQQNEIVLDSGNLQVAFLSPEKRPVAQAVLNSMVLAQEAFSQSFGPVPEHTQFRAAVVPEKDFSEGTRAPAWAQAIFDGIIRIPVTPGVATQREISRASINARHEMLHAWLSSLCGEIVPSWLGEGLAQKQEGRPISHSVAALRTSLGTNLPSNMPSDIWFEKAFFEAPTEVIGELYARSHILVESIEREHGNSTWRTIFSKSCTGKEPFTATLNNEFGAFTSNDLWKAHLPIIVGIFTNKK
jgi:tetratricopeptide (TPR) repeat protein